MFNACISNFAFLVQKRPNPTVMCTQKKKWQHDVYCKPINWAFHKKKIKKNTIVKLIKKCLVLKGTKKFRIGC